MLVPIRCHQCAAPIDLDDEEDIAKCDYCQASFWVKRPGHMPRPETAHQMRVVDVQQVMRAGQVPGWGPPTPGQASPVVGSAPMGSAPVASAPTQSKSSGSAVLPLFLALTIMLGIGAYLVLQREDNEVMEPASAAAEPGALTEKEKPKGTRIQADDLSKVDPADLIEQAVAFARKKGHPEAVLLGAHFNNLRGGQLDLSKDGDARFHVEFGYRTIDESKPAGEDVVAGDFMVNGNPHQGHPELLSIWAHHKGPQHARELSDENRKKAYPLPRPKCSGADAFAAAVKSGVPADAKTDLHWYKIDTYGSRSTMQWSFRVKGHDNYRREIASAAGCKLLRKWK